MSNVNLPKRVVLLSSGPPMVMKALHCLNQLNIDTDVVDLGVTSIAKFSRYRRKYINFTTSSSCEDLRRLSEFLIDYCIDNEIDAILAADVQSSGLLHAIKGELRDVLIYPVSNMATLNFLDDKWLFQQFMIKNGIPCPRSFLINSLSDLDSLTSFGISFPMIVKPLRGESSHGVALLRTLAEIHEHLRKDSRYAQLPLIAQEYVEGYDADLSILASEGVVCEHIIQSRRDPSSIQFIENNEILDIGKKIVKAAHYTGVANIDFRINELTGQVKVLECNPRFWYTLYASLWSGLNFIEAGFEVAKGIDIFREPIIDGVYYRHGALLKKVVFDPKSWKGIRPNNLRGLVQVLTDPLPIVVAALRS